MRARSRHQNPGAVSGNGDITNALIPARLRDYRRGAGGDIESVRTSRDAFSTRFTGISWE